MTYQERMDIIRFSWILLYILFPPLIFVMMYLGRGWRGR